MALAQGPYINMDGDPSFDLKASCEAGERGSKLANVNAAEAAYLKVASSWCPEYRPDAYVEAARQLAGEFPDDLDAQTVYADSLLVRTRWHWYDRNGAPAAGVADSETILQNIIRRWPQHPAANHLYIHAVESSPSPERAIASAQRLMGIVPWAGHMVHMPAHIWLVLGDWEAAAALNERAAVVDREYFKQTQVHNGTYQPYYLHNLHFILYARSMEGNQAQSLQAAETLTGAAGEMEAGMAEMADGFSAFATFVYARFNAWDSILKMREPGDKMAATKAAWRYARALALAAHGKRAAAEGERDQFEELRKSIPAKAPWGQNTARDVMHLGSEILAARFTEDIKESCDHWRRAVDIQDQFVYDEPPAWYYPVRESLGACLLRAGNNSEATHVFREGVRRSPRNGRMLFGLMKSLEAQGKASEGESVGREFAAAWAGSDIRLRIEDL
jgi:hypothetical protein